MYEYRRFAFSCRDVTDDLTIFVVEGFYYLFKIIDFFGEYFNIV